MKMIQIRLPDELEKPLEEAKTRAGLSQHETLIRLLTWALTTWINEENPA